MKKTISSIFLLLALFSFSIKSFAQDGEFIFGFKSGLNIADMSNGFKTRLHYQLGVTVDYQFTDNFYVMSGLNYQVKGGEMKLNQDPETNENYNYRRNIIVNPSYLQMPIHLGCKISLSESIRLVFNTGPYMAVGVAGKSKISYKKDRVKYTEEVNYFGSGKASRFDFGLTLGLGIENGGFVFGIGYDYGLINKREFWTGKKATNRNLELSFGFKFQ